MELLVPHLEFQHTLRSLAVLWSSPAMAGRLEAETRQEAAEVKGEDAQTIKQATTTRREYSMHAVLAGGPLNVLAYCNRDLNVGALSDQSRLYPLVPG